MGVEPDELHTGTIVWATVRDRHGYRKRRPVIILNADVDIAADKPLAVMAITTTFPDPPPPTHIELPWHPDRRRVSTGLARRSAAVINWIDTIYLDEVDERIGQMPPRNMSQILHRLSGGA